MMKKIILRKTDITSALLRIMLAIIIFPHGAQKMLAWFGGYGFNRTMSYFTDTLGLPYWIALIVIIIEFISPILLLLGSFSRIVAASIFALFIGIILTSHLDNGFFMNWFGNQPGEGYEYHLLILTISMAIIILGPGKYTIGKLDLKQNWQQIS
jgi:putative oxidoreductase